MIPTFAGLAGTWWKSTGGPTRNLLGCRINSRTREWELYQSASGCLSPDRGVGAAPRPSRAAGFRLPASCRRHWKGIFPAGHL